jgi:hypothetical protein
MDLYADENFPLRVVEELRRPGIDVVTATSRLHIQDPNHSGIIICTEDPDRLNQAQTIAQSIANAVELQRKLIRVYRRP